MAISLRRSFLGLWLSWTLAALAVAGITLVVFERTGSALIAKGRATAGEACAAAGARYRLLSASGAAAGTPDGRNRDLAVIMQASLFQFPGVEGSLWSEQGGFFGYAYPTYEGPAPKVDLPEAERTGIEALVRAALQDGTARVLERRGLREAVIVSACPMKVDGEPTLAAWTLLRVPLTPGGVLDYLALAGGLLLLFLVGSGVWVARVGLRSSRAFSAVEQAVEVSGADPPRDLQPTNVVEVDRIVRALNRFGARLEEARREAAALGAKASHVDRLTALGRVAAGLAHEIRNPVAAMRLKAENALAGPPERNAQALQAILGQIARIDRLVAEILTFAQPIALHVQPVPLRRYVSERIDGLRERFDVARVALEGHAGEETASFDAEQMARALDNLLINALQHTPAGGRVALRATVAEAMLTFTVSDTGPGIDPGIAARLFEPFATSRADGVGIGLSIVREVAMAHGGSVELADGSSSGGATFVVSVPCRPS
jgi:signal transduction histidine kinase